MVFKSERWQEGLPPSVSGSDPGAWRVVPHLRGPAARSLCSQTKGLFLAALRDHLLRLNQHVLNAVCTLWITLQGPCVHFKPRPQSCEGFNAIPAEGQRSIQKENLPSLQICLCGFKLSLSLFSHSRSPSVIYGGIEDGSWHYYCSD